MWPGKSAARRARLYQTLATALDAGLGVRQALDLANVPTPLTPDLQLSDILLGEMRIPDLDARVLSAAESAGVLPQTLKQRAQLLELEAGARRRFGIRLLYPVLLVHAAAVLPNLRWLVVGGVDDFLRRVVPVLLVLWGLGAGLTVLLVWCRKLYRRSPGFATFLRRLPVVGSLLQSTGAANYANLLSMLLAAGAPLEAALTDSAQCCGNAELEASGLRISAQVIHNGQGLGHAFQRESRSWPRLLIEAVRTGETAGRLEETLSGAARGLRQEADRRTEMLLTVVPTLIYLAAAVYVAWVVITTFTGLYSAL